MQTPSGAGKLPILLPDRPFENANKDLFTMANHALVKYHFRFSGCSTRFPCDFFHPTLEPAEI